jgi:hypothetical protein
VKALVALLVLTLAPAADAKCRAIPLSPVVLTPDHATLVVDGGIVVGAQSDPQREDMPEGDVVVQKGWRIKAGKDRVEPKIDSIAPGLAVYRLPATGDVLELEDAKQKRLVQVHVTKDTPAPLAAPAVTKIVATKITKRRTSTTVEVVLDGAAPKHAVAIVAVDAKGKAISWGRVSGGKLYAYEHQTCKIVSPGTVEPKAGDKVTLFWVDVMGRKSPATKPIGITKQ